MDDVGPVRSVCTDSNCTELKKLGRDAQGTLYIQLGNFPMHYLVLVITDQDFRYALISVQKVERSVNNDLMMEDIGWLNVRRIHGDEIVVEPGTGPEAVAGQKRKRDEMLHAAASTNQYPTRCVSRGHTKKLRN